LLVNRVWPDGMYRLGDWDDPACAQVVEVRRSRPGRSIRVAGTYGMDVTGKLIEPSDMAGQVRATMENIRRSLAAVGATPADVVRVKTYVTDMEAFKAHGVPEFRRFWAEHSPAGPPVSTAVQISRLGEPEALVEMEVDAELEE
jgi:enamine deaminase RidA (YjgF/YER057c/UK114 family)